MSHCGGPDGKIRHMQAQRLKQDFVNVIQQYQNTENTFSKRYRQQVARQIRIGNGRWMQHDHISSNQDSTL